MNDYKDGCVFTTPSQIADGDNNGTLVFQNMYSLSLGHSTAEGDSERKNRLDKLNVQQESACEAFEPDSLEKFQNQIQLHDALRKVYNPRRNLQKEIFTCLDTTALDEFSLDNFQNDAFLIQEHLADSFFVDIDVPLDNGVYNCGIKAFCDPNECTGPIVRIFQEKVFDAACESEMWIHASMLSGILVVLAFVSMQMCRREFVKAVVRAWWYELNFHDFTFIASCTRQGIHVNPDETPMALTPKVYEVRPSKSSVCS